VKCANCAEPALYVYKTPSVGPIGYCTAHLPSFLRPQAKAGMLDVTDAHAEALSTAMAVLSPEPAAEAVVEPAPKPKRAKKAVPEPEAE